MLRWCFSSVTAMHKYCRCSRRFAHDVVRAGSRAFIASTEEGSILEVHLPSMDDGKTHHLFTANSHLNALAPLPNGSIWCLLHNRGKVSEL